MNLKPYEIKEDFTVPIYMDTEFTSLSKDCHLLSIGLISEDDDYFYAEILYSDQDNIEINDWIRDNVVKNFINTDIEDSEIKHDLDDGVTEGCRCNGTKEFVSFRLKKWLESQYKKHGKKLQIYADCLAYDWVLFVDLLAGNALNLPEYIYYIPYDLSSVLQTCGIDPDVTRELFVDNYKTGIYYENNEPIDVKVPIVLRVGAKKHNALWDAYICKYIFKILNTIDKI